MCGLFGMAGAGIMSFHLDALKELALVSQLRGFDGAGVYQGDWYITVDDEYYINNERIIKTEHTMSNLLLDSSYKDSENKDLMDLTTNNFYVGHVRAATIGDINIDNTHPFETKKYVGCHNGTLIEKKYDHDKKTDSELFLNDMDKNGIAKVLEDLDWHSAYAISLFEKKEGYLTFARNYHRGLFFAVCKDEDVLYWASEKSFLQFALIRKKIDHKIYEVKEEKIYSVHVDDIKKGMNPDEDFETEILQNSWGYYGNYANYIDYNNNKSVVDHSNNVQEYTKIVKSNKKDFVNCRFEIKGKDNIIRTPLGHYMNENNGLLPTSKKVGERT